MGYRALSLFTLPDLVEELYVLAGEEMKTSIRYQKLDLITRYFYEDGTVLNAFGDPEMFMEEAEKVFKEPAMAVRNHLERSRKIYELTSELFIFNNFYRFGTFMSQKFIKAFLQIWKLDSLVTMHDTNSKRFNSTHLVQMFDRYATYNGSDPYRAPGTLNVISHLEHNLGAFFPEKGMYSLATGLKELADNLGVIFHFNQPVEKVVMDKRVVQGVVSRWRASTPPILWLVTLIFFISTGIYWRTFHFPSSNSRRREVPRPLSFTGPLTGNSHSWTFITFSFRPIIRKSSGNWVINKRSAKTPLFIFL